MATQLSASDDAEERRSGRRVASMPALLLLDGGRAVGVTMRDVSEAGFRFRIRTSLVTEGDVVALQFIVGPCRLARIVWVRGNEVGCEWLEASSAVATVR